MGIGPFDPYAPPGVFTSTVLQTPLGQFVGGLRIAALIGTAKETLTQSNIEMVRGSSSRSDTPIFGEDVSGRWVVSGTSANPTLGNQDGSHVRFKVRNPPVVDGDGRGRVTYDVTKVSVSINGVQTVVSALDGQNGIITLLTPPRSTDLVQVNYFFHRKDTRASDDVSSQVTAGLAILIAPKAESYVVNAGANDTLEVTVNDVTLGSITLNSGTRTANNVANDINAAAIPGLTSSVYTDNQGLNHVQLIASGNVLIGGGSANGLLGFNPGDYTNRTRSFRVFNGPIVDGTDGGVTTTDPTKVAVTVNGATVIASAVSGSTSLVTLPAAPANGAKVVIGYWFNTFQDTFDYLPNSNITSVQNVGIAPGRRDYIEGVDFTISNSDDISTIQWGTSFTVQEGVQTGSTAFGPTQIVGLLVDDKIFGAECERFTDTTTNSVSETRFVLPLSPTTGNGRDTPLGTSLFTSVTNGRIDLPTNRPDLVTAYVGKTWRDASSRPPVTVLEVDSASRLITLKKPVAADNNVYATFWYNRIQDDTYTFTVQSSGSSGVGQYKISSDSQGADLYSIKFGIKSGLSQVVQWPSGSELLPDAIHTGEGNPVSETVSVTFSDAISPATAASFTAPGQEPFDIYTYTRNFGGMQIDGNPAVTVDLSLAYVAHLLSTPVSDPLSFDSSDRLVLVIDGVTLDPVDLSAVTTLAGAAAAINAVVDADTQTHADGSGTFLSTAPNALASVLSVGTDNVLVIKSRNTVSSTNGLASSVTVISPVTAGETDGSSDLGLSPNQTATGSYNALNQPASLIGTKTGPFSISSGVTDSLQLNIDGFDLAVTLPAGQEVGTTEVVEAINDQYIGFASDTDIATYTANVIALANELRTDYNAHRVSTVFHVAADATNDVTLVASTTLTEAMALLNDIKSKFNSHLAEAGVHQMDDTTNAVSVANATNLQSAVVLANHLKDSYNSHLSQLGVHGYDDSTNTLLPHAVPVSNIDCYPILNDIKAKYNLHRVQSGSHLVDDTVNTVTAADAVSQITGETLANELKSVLNAHYIASGIHAVDDVTNTITSDDAGSPATLITLTTELLNDYPLHLSQEEGVIHVHGTNDATNVTTDAMSELVARVGQGQYEDQVILVSRLNNVQSYVLVKTSGNANDVLGFTSGASSQRLQPTASALAGALNADSGFSLLAVARRIVEPGLGGYLEIDSRTVGSTSTISFTSIANTTFTNDTGLEIVAGTSGDSGESSKSGFVVTSSAGAAGSGGTGFPGQTYTDETTGLRFTVLPSTTGDYADGGFFTLPVNQTFVADAAIPILAVPGTQLNVFNTSGMAPETTAVVNTYVRSGAEPGVGDIYYISYEYQKSDLSAQLYRDNRKIQQSFGLPTVENPLALGARLAQLNGAVVLALKQVLREPGSSQASSASFVAAIDEMRKPIAGTTKPDIITPLTTDPGVFSVLNQHCAFMGTPRQEGERMGVVGVAAGTSPLGVGAIAQGLNSELMIVTYPDSYVVTVEDSNGDLVDQLVDGSYCAAALAGSLTNPTFDAATPLTRRSIFGFKRVGRLLDPTEANQVAVNGVSVIDQLDTGMRVRHGLTTNVESVLTRTPSVTLTIQYVQQSLRRALDPYIGQKLTGPVLKSIETAATAVFSSLISRQIVQRVTGIEINIDENDPTVVRVSAIYIPVFPLEYIIVELSVRVRA